MEGSLAQRLGESPGQKTTDVFKEPRSHCVCIRESMAEGMGPP